MFQARERYLTGFGDMQFFDLAVASWPAVEKGFRFRPTLVVGPSKIAEKVRDCTLALITFPTTAFLAAGSGIVTRW